MKTEDDGNSKSQKNKKSGQSKGNKAYKKYSERFTPSPTYAKNCVSAFLVGGTICLAGYIIQALIMAAGADEETAGVWSTVALICAAQLITGFGWYNTLGKYGGAGAAVPITGFANSIVAPALEYKKEGIVMGVGAKIFSLSGPVLAIGFSISAVSGLVYKIISEI